MDSSERNRVIQGLLECADFLAAHPEVPAPHGVSINTFVDAKDDLILVARSGAWHKNYNDSYMWLRRTFCGGALIFDVNIMRGLVCRRIVKGTKTIAAQPERTVEDVEWVCDDALLSGGTRVQPETADV